MTAPMVNDAVPIAPFVVSGFGAALPARRVTNDELSARLDTSDEWIVARTGISERRVAEHDETTTALALSAAREALAEAGLTSADLALIVLATSTPDTPCPATAAQVAGALGATAAAFDVNGACTGFVHALLSASGALPLIAGHGRPGHALVIGADRFSTLIDPEDRSTAILFGDGAAAVVIGTTDARPDGPGLIGVDLAGDPDGLDVIGIRPGERWLDMDGPELFRRAVRALSTSGRQALSHSGTSPADIDLYLPHQANARIVRAAAERLGIPADRVVYDMVERANTSAASIPLAWHAAVRSGRIVPGADILMSGIGAGLAWGSLHLRWERA